MDDDTSAQHAMGLLFEVKEKLSDQEYKELSEAISKINPNKERTVEYPADLSGTVVVVTGTPTTHIGNLKRKLIHVTEKYNTETIRYVKHIAELSMEMLKLRKDWEEDIEEEED